ncbi:VCBS repeat-containing protein [Marinicella sp. S1101]|uniref:FG-GAP repeat domain-containing protein n=1 Tax=Marinicella marina TaxID=2996016 RepID=UPI002260DE26|nr:VCBS repeat-containing protein [Marinicella marina]MCX7553234.1 VCBS repeat-containing protein [Marinicella marina]MDJ1138966.1 VCBS repeat-containing protein [Marinicella marina]
MNPLLVLLIAASGFMTSPVRSQSDGWSVEYIHGPSQVGIVDSIPVDLNQDGLMDVVSVSIDDGQLRAYINQGNLAFEQQVISEDVMGAFRVSATDLNNDGEVDFLIPSIETQEVIALVADTQAVPTGYQRLVIASQVLLPTDAQAGDFNGDGLMDVVSVSFEENAVLLHTQNNQGEFATSVISEAPLRPRKLLVDDFNGDDNLDFMLASEEDNSIRLYSGDGVLMFNETLISDQLTGVRYIANCDVPGAEFPNFVAGVTGANQVILFENQSNNSFDAKVIDGDLPGANAMHCADLDQDNELEILGISTIFGIIYQYDFNNTFTKQVVASSRDGYINVNTADFTGDAQPTVLTQAFFESRNLLYEPIDANLETVVWEDFADGAYYVEADDIDADGDIDYAYAAFREDKVYVAESTPQGYRTHVVFEQVEGPQSVSLIDFDADGDVDVFSAGAFDDSFRYHENIGAFNFNTQLMTASANNAARLVFLDVNDDEQLDVVTSSSLDDSIRWFDWSGSQFTEQLLDNQMDGALALAVSDVDGNQKQDLIVGNFAGNDIWVFYNLGSGNFSKSQLITGVVKPTVIIAADFNANQLPEIIFNESQVGRLWMLGDQTAAFNGQIIHDRGQPIPSFTLSPETSQITPEVIDVSSSDSQLIATRINAAGSFTNRFYFDNQFGARDIISLDRTDSETQTYITASNVNNAIKALRRMDLIFASGFDGP